VDDYGVSMPPFAVRIDIEGRVTGRGIVTNLRQLENLEREASVTSRLEANRGEERAIDPESVAP